MTKQTATVDVSAFSTDAKFRTWGQAASTCLQTCGLVMTSDTGQINWTTVTKPTTAGTKAGYEIYRFADTLQSTKPIFIRVDYGSSSIASGNGPSAWVSVGTGTDGAGNLTGLTVASGSGNLNISFAMSNTAMTMQFTHSVANGYALLNFGMGVVAAAGTPGIFIIERTKDSSGSPTGSGVGLTACSFVSAGTNTTCSDRAINFDTSTAFNTSRNPYCGALAAAYSLTSGATVAQYRHYIGAGTLYNAVGRLTHFTGDIAGGTVFTSTPVGSTPHTYYAWGGVIGADSSASANLILDWLWED